MTKIVHLTSVHPRYDTRIFSKECKSLSKKYKVTLIVADGKGKEDNGEINIIDVGKPLNRKERILNITRKILRKAVEINADIYHFHDPELIPVGLKLKKLGKKVIYDVHEDVPRQILSKPYLNRFLKPIISKAFEVYENYAARKFDAIIAATPYIRDRFLKLNKNTIDANNYPKLSELYDPVEWSDRKNEICYIGGISRIRGIIELVKALEYTNTILHLAGNFESEELENQVKSMKGWGKVKYYGFVGRGKIKEILRTVKIGIIPHYPTPSYINGLPIKLFEYMISGIPVIASAFPVLIEIIEKNSCGICVNPLKPREIAGAVNYLLNNDRISKDMGENGKRVIKIRYNWENEEKKLFELYAKLLNSSNYS